MKKDEDVTPATVAGGYADAIGTLWTAVLGAACDRRTNFFDIGGTSLKMMRVHIELQRKLGFEVSIVELFAHPTIDALAERLAVVRAIKGKEGTSPDRSAKGPPSRIFRPKRSST